MYVGHYLALEELLKRGKNLDISSKRKYTLLTEIFSSLTLIKSFFPR